MPMRNLQQRKRHNCCRPTRLAAVPFHLCHWLLLLLLLVAIGTSPVANGSLFCPYTAYPSADADFEEFQVEVHASLDDPIQLGQPIYRLAHPSTASAAAQSAAATAFRPIPGERPFRLFKSAHSAECPKRGCLHELALAEPRIPGTLFYHTDTIMGKLIPPGFLTVEANPRLYCSIVRDDCGANVPIHRHFKVIGPRVYYAYSTGSDAVPTVGANFTRESMPMCFGWSVERPASSVSDEGKEGAAATLKTVKMAAKNEEKEEEKKQRHIQPADPDTVAVKKLLNTVPTESEEEEEAAAGKKVAKSAKQRVRADDECFVGNAVAAAAADADVDDDEKEENGDGTAANNGTFAAAANGTTVKSSQRRRSHAGTDGGFVVLSEWDNGRPGTLRDHLYTTRGASSWDSSYKLQKQLGQVLSSRDESKSNCSAQCLLKIGQMLANQSDTFNSIFSMRDHKLVLMGHESADAYYSPTGETFYCARREGQCGANVPLRRYWHLTEMDTIMTAASTPSSLALVLPTLSIPTWDGVLCYIWPV